MPAVRMPSRFDQRAQVSVDPLARNPLVDDYVQISPRMSGQRSTAPTLFNSGDLPPYTASGNPPSELLKLPWQLRHAAAKADQAEWARLMNDCTDPAGADYAMLFDPAANDPGNGEYEARVRAWAGGR